MTLDIPYQRLARTGFPIILCVLVLSYFGVHAVTGDSGLGAWFTVTQKIGKLETELAVTQAERTRLAHKVSLLRADSLDADLVDETARHTLGLAHPHDVIIFLDE